VILLSIFATSVWFSVGHSAATAVLKVLNEILHAIGGGDVAALVFLDLSVAFDSVDREIHLK
jgi:hypothetical protein